MLTDDQITAAYKALGVSAEDLCAACLDPSKLVELRNHARRQYRRLALMLHPDKTGGDERKAQLFRAITEVMEDLKELRAEPLGFGLQWAIKLSVNTWS